MKSSTTSGLLLGLLLTIIGGYYMFETQYLKAPSTGAKTSTLPINSFAVEPADLPLVSVFDSYQTTFPGSDDLLAYRAKLLPHMSLPIWDRTFTDTGLPTTMQTSTDCRIADLAHAIYIPPIYADAVSAGKINVLFVERVPARCYGVRTKVAVVVDDLSGGKNYYQILGEATIDRIVEVPIVRLPDTFFKELGIAKSDVSFLSNPDARPMTTADAPITVLRFTMTGQQPILDLVTIPPFVPGAEVLRADSITRYFKGSRTGPQPIFVDARDRKSVSSGARYPGAVQAPFISSSPVQLRFQLEFPLSALAGAKFDLRQLPVDRRTPLIVFGNGPTDPAPLWMIRNLRQQNYRSLYFVEGGLKALQEVKPSITF